MSTNARQNNRSIIRTYKNRFFRQFPVSEFTLPNGLKILFQQSNKLPLISMYTLYRVGSRNERSGITGISHLFEHMMFNGSKKFGPKEFDRRLESGGGHSNAYTSHDMTVYYEDFAPSLLETVLDMESDRMANLDLNAGMLKSEREVVKEERRVRTDNSIFGRLDEELYAASYQAHPYRWPVIGWMSDIENIKLEDCQNYFHDYYAPNNAVIVIAGDFDTEKTKMLFKKYYSKIPSRKTPDDPQTMEPEQKGEKRIKYKKKSELHNFVLGYHIPGIESDDLIVLDVIQTIFSGGESSIMQKKMIRESDLALYASVDFVWQLDPGLMNVLVQMKPGRTYMEGEQFIDNEFARLCKEEISNEELNRAVSILESDFIYGLQTNSGRAHRLGLSEIMLGGYKKMFNPSIKYSEVTVADVQNVIQKYFKKDNKTIVWLEPDSE